MLTPVLGSKVDEQQDFSSEQDKQTKAITSFQETTKNNMQAFYNQFKVAKTPSSNIRRVRHIKTAD